MIEQQQKLVLSPYMEIYELVIPKDNLLRQIKERHIVLKTQNHIKVDAFLPNNHNFIFRYDFLYL